MPGMKRRAKRKTPLRGMPIRWNSGLRCPKQDCSLCGVNFARAELDTCRKAFFRDFPLQTDKWVKGEIEPICRRCYVRIGLGEFTQAERRAAQKRHEMHRGKKIPKKPSPLPVKGLDPAEIVKQFGKIIEEQREGRPYEKMIEQMLERGRKDKDPPDLYVKWKL